MNNLQLFHKTKRLVIPIDYITYYTCDYQSKQICNILSNYSNDNMIITDCNAGIGGNSYYFCKQYQFVNVIDKNNECMKFLDKNLIYFDNKFIINDDCLDILKIIQSDIIFFDPPWGDNYKYNTNIDLFLNNIPINHIIDNCYNICQLIALKAPNNYLIKHSNFWKIKEYNIYKNYNSEITFKLIIFYKTDI